MKMACRTPSLFLCRAIPRKNDIKIRRHAVEWAYMRANRDDEDLVNQANQYILDYLKEEKSARVDDDDETTPAPPVDPSLTADLFAAPTRR